MSKIETTFDGDTVWLSIDQMAELFKRDRSVISKHIKNVFEEGELPKESNVRILHVANSDKPVEFYNLDVILSVGYRVKSKRGAQYLISIMMIHQRNSNQCAFPHIQTVSVRFFG